MTSGKWMSLFSVAALLSACGGSPEKTSAPTNEASAASEADAAANIDAEAANDVVETAQVTVAPASFGQCAVCHSVEAGKNGVGPSLAGIYDRKAATVAGFAYSDALKQSGIVWDEAALDKWLISPAKDVPGTKMIFAGYSDAGQRKEVIDYMKTL